MTKSQLITRLAEEIDDITHKEAEVIVNTIFGSMREALIKGERIEIRGFGSIKVKRYKPYKGRNPRTGKLVNVPKKRLPVFKTSDQLKKRVNKNSQT